MNDLGSKNQVDRLPIVISGIGIKDDQLLAIPKLTNGTGKAQAEAVCKQIMERHIADNVSGLCSDSNNGKRRKILEYITDNFLISFLNALILPAFGNYSGKDRGAYKVTKNL